MHLLVQLAVFAFLATTMMAADNQPNQELIHPKTKAAPRQFHHLPETKAASGGQVYPFGAKCTWAILQEGVPTNQSISSCVLGNSTSPLTSGTVAYAKACWSSCLPGEVPPCEGWQRGPIQGLCQCGPSDNGCYPICDGGDVISNWCTGGQYSCSGTCTCSYTYALIDAVSDIACNPKAKAHISKRK